MTLSVRPILFFLLVLLPGGYTVGQEKSGTDFAAAKQQRQKARARTLRSSEMPKGILYSDPQQTAGAAPLRNIYAKTELYGTVIYADSWTAANTGYGIYSFRASVSPGMEKKMSINGADGMAGDFAEGKYCYFDYTLFDGQVVSVNYHIVDPGTWTQTTVPKNSSLCACTDITYDRIGKKMYGCSPYAGSTGSALVEIDPANGDPRYITSMPYMLALACDAAGTIFGIYIDNKSEGILCRIDPLTGETTDIGTTGVKISNYLQSATIDYSSNTMYWATTTAEETGALYKINTLTGEASYIVQFPENEEITGLCVPAKDFPGEAPDRVEGLTAVAADPSVLEAYLSFTAPRLQINGDPLAGLEKIAVYRGTGNEPVHTFAQPEPGTHCSWTDRSAVKGTNTYRVVASNTHGEGPAAFAWTYVGPDLPAAVKDLTVVLVNGHPVISWTAPQQGINGQVLDPASLTYRVERIIDGVAVTLAENTVGTTFSDTNLTLSQQNFIYYRITAVSAGGPGAPALSKGILFGPPYRLTFYESFTGQRTDCSPWKVDLLSGDAEWKLSMISNFPGAMASDNDYGMAVFNSFHSAAGSQARLCSPKIALQDARDPVLYFNFYYYQLDEDKFRDKLQIEISADGGEYLPVSGASYELSDYNIGWTTIEVSLADYKNTGYISIGFMGTSAYGANLLVDRIIVKDKVNNDLQMLALTGPAEATAGKKAVLRATVCNNGIAAASGFTVRLITGGETIRSLPGPSVNPDQVAAFTFGVEIPIEKSGEELTWRAEVVAPEDENEGNNLSGPLTVRIVPPPFSPPAELQACMEGENVKLDWQTPGSPSHPGPVTDNLDAYESFAVSGIGDYTLYDIDGMPTLSLGGNYPNEGQPIAYMLFNPGILGLTASIWAPHSGDQYLACFPALSAPNDDWIVSPELSGESQTVSFFARSINSDSPPERFRVLYSTGGKEITDFIPVGNEPYEEAPAEWTPYSYLLPEGARYFAVNCVSSDQSVFMIDDLSYTPATGKPMGYNIYANGSKLNTEPVVTTSYTHTGIQPDTLYTYHVTGVYAAGESAFSESAFIHTSGLEQAETGFPTGIRYFPGGIKILNPDRQEIILYTAGGKVWYRGNEKEITVGGLPAGIYLLKAGNSLLKAAITQ